MMPTATQMLASVQLALTEHVTPRVEDQWGQSALRSIDAILNHLQARLNAEGPMLHEDTGELAVLLGEAGRRLDIALPGLADFLQAAEEGLAGYAPVETLQALNHAGRDVLDAVLLECHARKGDPTAEAVHASLRAYLLRHADRESAWFFPVYVGRPV